VHNNESNLKTKKVYFFDGRKPLGIVGHKNKLIKHYYNIKLDRWKKKLFFKTFSIHILNKKKITEKTITPLMLI